MTAPCFPDKSKPAGGASAVTTWQRPDGRTAYRNLERPALWRAAIAKKSGIRNSGNPNPRARHRCEYDHLPTAGCSTFAHPAGKGSASNWPSFAIVNSPHCCNGNHYSTNAALTGALWNLLRDQQKAFSQIAAWAPDRFNLGQGGEARYADALMVSGEFLRCTWRTATPGAAHIPGG